MNSSTSSSSFRRFGLGFLILAFAPGLCLFYLGIWLEPLAGDLTRIGGFSERDYGWQAPQIGFKNPLPVDEAAYTYRDIWVLGDSFATAWPKLQWQNYLREKTGGSIGTQNINRVSIDQLLQDTAFKAHPPKVLILESAERYLTLRLKAPQETKTPSAPNPIKNYPRQEMEVTTNANAQEPFLRSKAFADIQISFAGRFLLRSFQREVLGQNPGNALRLRLLTSRLFTSRQSQELLVFREDLQKESLWRALGVAEIFARLERLKTRVEANGVTHLVVLIAPDKLTAYRHFLDEPRLHPYSEANSLIARGSNLMPDTASALERALQEGVKDLYLPNDTHWGSAGQETVAVTLLNFLKKHDYLKN